MPFAFGPAPRPHGPDPADQTANYNTPLAPDQEAAFLDWIASHPKANGDLRDYDVRGAWKANAIPASGHGPDTYKKPNHPTFSDESIYSGPASQGGKWEQTAPPSRTDPGGMWSFAATPDNMKYRSIRDLMAYFAQVEPGNQLNLQLRPGAKPLGFSR